MTEIERKEKLIEDAIAYKEALENQLILDKEIEQSNTKLLRLLKEINHQQDFIIDLLTKLDKALINFTYN